MFQKQNCDTPLVAIQCLVYNHEKYLRDCLDGFIMQKTNFKFVAIVHDDVSTDNSVSIIKEYVEKYPEIIIPIYETENQYSKGFYTIQKIMCDACNKTGAKYIALCEGDDYWTDPYKLQKQVDFLISNNDYSMCFHAAQIINESGNNLTNPLFTNIMNKEYVSDEIKSKWIVATASVVYRRDMVCDFRLHHPEWLMYGDIALFLTCSELGKVMGMSDVMSVYRINSGGVTMKKEDNIKRYKRAILHEKCLRLNFSKLSKSVTGDILSKYFYTLSRQGNNPLEKMIDIFEAIFYSPGYVLKKLFK